MIWFKRRLEMNRQGGSTSVVVVAVLAVGALATAGTWWVMKASTSEEDSAASQGQNWSELRAELAELRGEVEELREEQSRRNFESLGPIRDRESQKAASEDSKGDSKDEDPKEKAFAGKGKEGSADYAAMQAMQKSEDPAERRALAEQLLESEQFWLRSDAILELLQHDPATAVAAMHELLEAAANEPKGGYAANRAVEALGDLEGYAIGNDLRRIYDEVEIKGVSLAAARSLDRQGDSSLIQREVRRFTELLHGEDEQARMWGVSLLGETRSAVAVPHLLPLLQSPDVQMRIRALDALGRTGGAGQIATIEAMLNDPVAAVRDRAVEALAKLRRRADR